MKDCFVFVVVMGLSLSAFSCKNQESVPLDLPEEPNTPPIDCPLLKQGIEHHDMKPFETTEKYIKFLEREDRAQWQKPDVVVKALGLDGLETISDVGAGSGYFTFRLAQAVPNGRVFAIDVEPEMLRHIHHKAMGEGIKNIEVVAATFDDPRVSASSDLVFICDVLHHVKDREQWLGKIFTVLRPKARVAILEFKEGKLPAGPPESLKIPKQDIIALFEKVGFKMAEDKSGLIPYQHFLIFEKP
jgi:ubiquinone/menaquinone biosynthesis C-methylase UbiE